MRTIPHLESRELSLLETWYVPGSVLPLHAHDYSNITAVLSGELIETTQSGEFRARTGSVVVKPQGTLHMDRVMSRSPVLTISIRFSGESPLTNDLPSWRWLDHPRAVMVAFAFLRNLRSGQDPETAAYDFAHAVVAQCAESTESRPSWFMEMCEILERKHAGSLRFDALARQFGLHPVYAARGFRRYAGMSMGEFVRATRLREAQRLIGSSPRSLQDISADTGFADPSHFARRFSAATGLTPREFRSWCRDVSRRTRDS